MDWYCSVWNSDSVSSAVGAEVLYEMICQGDTSLVGDIDLIDEFYEELNSKKFNDVFVSDNGYATKIEIEYINFKGSFYFHF